MSTFIYEAYNKERSAVRGEYEAVDRDEVVAYLLKRDLTPISVESITDSGKKRGLSEISLFEKITPVDVMFLVRNMATTIKAGLSIVESLDILIADAEKGVVKKMLQSAQAIIKGGQTLSAGFSAHAHVFPPIFLGMVRAGEASGQLERTLSELGAYLAKEYALRAKIKSALMYPMILLIAASGVVFLLLVFVLPRLTKAFASSGVKLPWITKFFLSISEVLTWSYFLDVAVIVGAIFFFGYFRKTKVGKVVLFWIISHLSVASELVKKIALVRFARTAGNLVASGLSAVESLELSAQTIGNDAYARAIEASIEEIKRGTSISEALAKHPKLFPRLLISLLIVAERTGSLSSILITFADFYEEEVDNKLKDLASVLEPILLLVMGLIVGAIAFSIILPIYQLVSHFV